MQKTSFDEMVTEMVTAGYELAKRDALVHERATRNCITMNKYMRKDAKIFVTGHRAWQVATRAHSAPWAPTEVNGQRRLPSRNCTARRTADYGTTWGRKCETLRCSARVLLLLINPQVR